MKKTLILIFLLPILAISQTNIPGGSVNGVWTADNSPYLIQGDITVDSAQTLEIKPGVRVEFQGHYGLEVNGIIRAIGTIDSMITFTVSDTTGFSNPDTSLGGWKYLRLNSTSDDTCILKYSRFSYLKKYPYNSLFGIIFCENYNLFSNNIVRENYQPIYEAYSSSITLLPNLKYITITNNVIINNNCGGILMYVTNNKSPIITNNIISNNRYAFTMYYHDTSNAQIYNNTICNNEEVFYYLEDCSFTIRNSIIYGNTYNYGYNKINCLESDPLFYNPPQGTGPGYYNGDVNLYPTENSPAVDAGDTTGLPFIPATDFYGRPRIYGNGIDIGALEWQPGVFVDEISGKEFEISLYPNPAKDYFYIKSELKINIVKLYNLEGKLIKTFNNSNNYNIQDLKSGVYLLKIRFKNKKEHYSYHLIKL